MDTLGPFLGMNTRLPDFALRVPKKGDYLRGVDNAYFANDGSIVSRPSIDLVQALTGAHSLFGNYLVIDSALYRITLPTYSQTFVTALASNAPMSYVTFAGDIYFSNGTDSGRIAANGAVYPWALPTPNPPTVTPASGALEAGWYQVGVSYSNSATGEEGGVSASANLAVADNGGVTVSLPGSAPGASHVNVYLSAANGSVPRFAGSFIASTPSATLTVVPTGREAPQRFEQPLRAGTRLFMHNGRLCSVNGRELNYSLPFRPGYCLTSDHAIYFPDDITIAVSAQKGVYVATTAKTHFFPGADIGNVTEDVVDALPFGAVPGTEFELTHKPIVGWFSPKGIALADTQGHVELPMMENVTPTPPASGVSIVFETLESRHVVSCGWCLNADTGAASTYSNYTFNSVSNGYVAEATGICSLVGTGPVDATIHLGKLNFGSEVLKHLPAVYLGTDAEEPMEMLISTPNNATFDYAARAGDSALKLQRVDPGRGLRATWYDITIRNAGGCAFTLASVSFANTTSKRRI